MSGPQMDVEATQGELIHTGSSRLRTPPWVQRTTFSRNDRSRSLTKEIRNIFAAYGVSQPF